MYSAVKGAYELSSKLTVDIPISIILFLSKVWRCGLMCPQSQRYCSSLKQCLPQYLECRPPANSTQQYAILGNIDISSLPLAPFFISASINASAILTNPLNATNIGDWMVFLSNGTSFNLTSLSAGVVVDRAAYLKFKSSRGNAYGIRTVNYFLVSDLVAQDRSLSFTVGSVVSTRTFNKNLKKTAALIIKPIARFQQLKAKSPVPVITIEEDSKMDVKGPGFRVPNYLTLKTEIEDHEIPRFMYPYIPREELDLYHQYKMTFSRRRSSANVVSMNGGTWQAKIKGEELFGGAYDLQLNNKFPVFGSDLYFFPLKDFTGTATLALRICYCNMMHPEDVPLFINITINVRGINDRPVPLTLRVNLPPIGFNSSNNGFSVASLGFYAKDPEQVSFGIAILSVSKSQLGKWYYKFSSGAWVEYNPQRKNGNKQGNISVLHLKPEDSLKFFLQKRTTQWTTSSAFKQAWLRFAFWDMTDGKPNGILLAFFCVFSFAGFLCH